MIYHEEGEDLKYIHKILGYKISKLTEVDTHITNVAKNNIFVQWITWS